MLSLLSMHEDSPIISNDEDVPVKKTVRRRPLKKTRRPAEPDKSDRINASLEAIYRDSHGDLPNMRQIKIKKSHPILQGLLVLLTAGVLIGIAAWVGFFVLPSTSDFSEGKVDLTISGPTATAIGATTTYTIAFSNHNQKTTLDTAGLTLQYPVGFVFVTSSRPLRNSSHNELNVGAIDPGASGEVTVTGQLYGTLNNAQSLRALLNYQPKGLTSRFQKNVALTIATTDSPISLAIGAPGQITADTDTDITYSIVPKGSLDRTSFPPLRLQPVLPSNFTIVSSSPELGKAGSWNLDFSSSTQKNTPITFKLRGRFVESNDPTTVGGQLTIELPQAKEPVIIAAQTIPTQISKNGFTVNLAANGSLGELNSKPGDTLALTLNLKNTGPSPVTNAIVALSLDTPSNPQKQSIIKWSDIDDPADGDIKGEQISATIRHGQIVWNKKKIPALAEIKPGAELNINLSLPVKNADDVDLTKFTTTNITGLASIDFTDSSGAAKHLSSSPLSITLNSDLELAVTDTVTPNGTSENHAISWVLTNNFHPLKNITLSATLFGDVTLANTSSTPAGQSSYDTANQKLTWTIPTMPDGIDVLAWPFSVILNQKKPAQNTLVSKISLTAEDTVTGQTISLTGNEIKLKND